MNGVVDAGGSAPPRMMGFYAYRQKVLGQKAAESENRAHHVLPLRKLALREGREEKG
jgi:hypothetical protein